MHFNIYIDDQLAQRLKKYAQKQGVTRNKLISQALDFYITEISKKWPEKILNFKGVPDFPAFEDSREE